ncbi:MAG: flagellar filament capping protein FliD [Phycisphaerales bacterium]
MGGISSSGLVSGIDTQSIIQQLLAIESRPKIFAQQRIVQLQTQQAAYLDVNSQLLNLRSAASAFRASRVFDSTRATSSNPNVLSATTSTSASPGAYNFIVNRLVSSEQQISRGFTDRNVSAVGLTELTVEIGGGTLSTDTRLSSLNGGDGVARGKIKITTQSGDSAEVDLSSAITISDVISAINGTTGIDVEARIDGDRLVIEDNSVGAIGSSLRIENVFGSNTATSLGIAGVNASGVITGSNINRLSANTALSSLNDGTGVGVRANVVSDFRITARDGTNYNVRIGEVLDNDGEVTRTAASTLQDVIDRINEDTDGNVTASIGADGVSLQLTDNTGGGGDIIVAESDTGRTTARDLGILGTSSGATLSGRRLIAGLNTTLLSSLNGGAGATGTTISLTTRNGANTDVAIDANGSVADVVNAINNSGAGVTAALNRAGNGLILTDTTSGGGTFTVGGDAAASFNIDGSYTDGVARTDNLQTRWVGNGTLLSSLNSGTGVGTGSFRIVDSTGAIAEINVGESIRTVDDIIGLINSRPLDVKARINDTGDGIILEDESGGAQAIRVEDVNGTVARKLNIAGTAESSAVGENVINGSFERTFEFEATDTLQDIADEINSVAPGFTASIVNDGGGSNPFRLSLTSQFSGRVGRLSISTEGTDLGLTTLTQGRDAVVFYGSTDPAQAIALTSSTNSLSNVITGVTVNLEGTSSGPVELVVSRDTEKMEKTINEFVDAFNLVIDSINKYDSYDQETNKRGPLLGDSAVSQIRRGLYAAIQGTPFNVDGELQRLSLVGVKIGDGAKLEFDAQKFREEFADNPQAVEDLFAAFDLAPREDTVLLEDEDGNPIATTPNTDPLEPTKMGIAEIIKRLSDQYTNSIDGLLTRRKNTLTDQIDLQAQRIAGFDVQLERKRLRLEQQFIAMEQAIASLQSQQAALGSIG